MTDDAPSDELLARVIAGEADADEVAIVERWASADRAHRALLDELGGVAAPRASTWATEAAWQKVAARLHTGERPAAVLPIARPEPRTRHLLRLAAMVVVVLGALFAWQMLRPSRTVLELATAPGEIREVTLPDGSLAVLAAGSRLTVPIGYGPEHRTVRLEGEAWFHAMHEGQPFIVQSGSFEVRDIGTTFTVEGRRHRHFRVTVVDGSVEVRLVEADARLALLAQGDVADFHEDGALLAVHHDQPVETRTAWRSGSLQFVDAPVMDVLERLSAWFGREIRIAPALTIGRTLTATFPTDSFDATLEILASLLGVAVVPDDDNGVWLQ
jgi:transmembrane sensor